MNHYHITITYTVQTTSSKAAIKTADTVERTIARLPEIVPDEDGGIILTTCEQADTGTTRS